MTTLTTPLVPEEMEDYIERHFKGWPEQAKQELLSRARNAHEHFHLLLPKTSRLTGQPLPPVNQPGPLDPDTQQVIRIHCPRTAADHKAELWAVAQANHPDREKAIAWGKHAWERSVRPRKHHIALIEAELQKCHRAKELMPTFDDHGAQNYLEAALAWWQKGDAVE